jgi:hypothetical protein
LIDLALGENVLEREAHRVYDSLAEVPDAASDMTRDRHAPPFREGASHHLSTDKEASFF